jgi:hypothetical protein
LTLEALGNVGEFLGALGVIVSLGYLAIQIRQNTNAVKGASNHALNDSFSDFLKLLIVDQRAADIFAVGVRDIDSLNDRDRDTFYSLMALLFNHFENTHLHHERGLIDSQQWERWRIAIGWYAGFPGVEVWWRNRSGIASKSFRAYVNAQRAEHGATDPNEWAPDRALEQLADPR